MQPKEKYLHSLELICMNNIMIWQIIKNLQAALNMAILQGAGPTSNL